MRYSLNQIKTKLELFATDHLQVNQFYCKDPLELLNDSETRFMAMVAMFNPSRIEGKEVLISASIFMMDLVNKDLTNELEVSSDTLLVLTDLKAYLDNPDFDDLFTIDDNAALEPFYEKGDNEVTGWKMDITFKVIHLLDRCAIPV